MLILMRRENEEITIYDSVSKENIVLKIVKISGSQAKIGITANKRFSVVRSELLVNNLFSENE